MFQLIYDFQTWCHSIEPKWVGAVIYVTTVMWAALMFATFVFALVMVTRGWILIAIPALFAYCLYVAFFMQGTP